MMIEGALQIAHRLYALRKKRERLDSIYMKLVAKATKIADEINAIDKEIKSLEY